jgi:outer membrane protein assembly factor BamB
VSVFTICFVSLLFAGNARVDDAGNWPEFRGGKAGGVVADADLPDRWSKTENVHWKTTIPGKGWSSPVIWGDKVFVTSVIREGKEPLAKKGLYFGGEQFKPPTDVHRWMVYAVSLESGKILWEKEVHRGVPQGTHHVKNSFASETPVVDSNRVYAYFGNLGVFCFDHEGKELWTRKWETMPTQFAWGTGASPILYGDRLIIVNDNEKSSFLAALNTQTGDEVMRLPRDEKSNWATPFIWENDQRTEIITCGKKKVRSYSLDGKLLWELGGMSSIVIPTPLSKFGLLYVASGYVMDSKKPLFAIRPGASGDITLGKEETSNKYIAWCQKTGGPYNPSPIIYGDNIYVLFDAGMVSCFDAKTGQEYYHKERLGSGEFTSSPWAYNGKIFFLSEDGKTFVIKAGKKFELLAKNSLEEMCLATPAIARGNLIIRTESQLYCIRNLAK